MYELTKILPPLPTLNVGTNLLFDCPTNVTRPKNELLWTKPKEAVIFMGLKISDEDD